MKISEFVEDFNDLDEAYTFHGDPCISPNAKYREICIGHRKGYDDTIRIGLKNGMIAAHNYANTCQKGKTPSYCDGCQKALKTLQQKLNPINPYMIRNKSTGKFASHKQPPTQPATPVANPVKPIKPM